jgi:flagellar biosynthesis/type III secretory pathway M-ring protein FliF/YscJ
MLSLAVSVLAQADQEDSGYYSWIILVGLLIMLVMLGAVIQLRKTRPAKKVKEEDLEDVEGETEHPERKGTD